MLKWYRADLHIHTCLSPCADLTMSPKRIVEKAIKKNLDIIGICDHNSAENVKAAKMAGINKNITVLPGIEVSSKEEVHVVALFEEIEAVIDLQEMVYENLEPGENKEDVFGEQIIVNEYDEVEGYNKKLLMLATQLPLKKIVNKIHRLGGLAIAAHIDRDAFSIISQLGFIPEDLKLDAIELSTNLNRSNALKRFPDIKNIPLVSSSDAHFLKNIGDAFTNFLLVEPIITEIHKAFNKSDGRNLQIEV